jgi:hypothetical protein
MLRMRHFFRLCGEFLAYARINRAWWVIPPMILLALIMVLILVGQAAAPVTLYPLF